jgi:hypothetical protein
MLAWCVGCGSTTTAPAIAPTAPVEESAATARAVPDLDVSRYPYTFRLIGEQERERVEHEIEAGSPGWDVEIGELGYVTGGYARLDALGEDRDAAIATFVDRWRTPLGLAPDAVSGWSDYYRAWGVSTHPPWPYVRTTFGIEGELVVLRGHGFHGLPYPSRGSDAEPPSVLERYVGRPITITHSVHSRPCDPARQCRTVEECCGRPPEAPPPRDELLTADRLRPIAGLVISFDRARGVAEVREVWRITFVTRHDGDIEEHVRPHEPIPRFVDARTGEPLEIQDQFGQAEAIVAFDGDRFLHASTY